MEPGSRKHYYVDGFHSRKFLDTYYSSNPEVAFAHENLRYPMEKFHQAFSTGDIKGGLLLDFSIGPIIHHLYSATKYFTDIILLKPTDHCIVEVKKWMDSRTGAFDWSHTSALATELAGTSDQYEEPEDKDIGLRAAITHVVKFDLSRENLTDPLVLPQADCLVINTVLGVISRDLEDLERNLGRFSKLLKPGGHLLYYGYLNATFYVIGEDRFHAIKYNESDLRRILSNEGFVIRHIEVSQTKIKSDLSDFDSVVFCTACKEQKI
ncbi:PREDICTED: nicotinamide N-methyltransferase-like [Nanorana parkeri]|uniref:nicotinamide N-methyltransferase-like n=1 Tax=Nanorana parkeri TaxID=125878 RepID=UPI00085502AE|nr:PREDICTED: nicotinamide N-methyltransferase-like [Nanorana parkeri]